MNYAEFWTDAHARRDPRWLAFSEPQNVISRFDIDLAPIRSVLEVGPGIMLLADYLTSLGKRVVVHDIVPIDDPRFVASLPLHYPVDMAIAHLVFQHVEAKAQRRLVLNVLESLKLGGSFYFDAVTEDTSHNPDLAEEYKSGTSVPFAAWDLITSKREVQPGYFFCVAKA